MGESGAEGWVYGNASCTPNATASRYEDVSPQERRQEEKRTRTPRRAHARASQAGQNPLYPLSNELAERTPRQKEHARHASRCGRVVENLTGRDEVSVARTAERALMTLDWRPSRADELGQPFPVLTQASPSALGNNTAAAETPAAFRISCASPTPRAPRVSDNTSTSWPFRPHERCNPGDKAPNARRFALRR